MTITRGDVLNMSNYDCNVEIDRLLFKRTFMSVEEMKENSAYWWKEQPLATNFTAGYDAWLDDNKVFQWKYRTDPYSTSISAAWKVVEKMKKEKWSFTLSVWGDDQHFEESEYVTTFGFENGPFQASALSAPLAICRAALLAIMDLE